MQKDSMERGDISQRNGNTIFPAADGRDQELRTSTLIRQRPIRGESHLDFLGESEGSLPPPHDSFPEETSYTAITLNPESNFTRREKSHSLFH